MSDELPTDIPRHLRRRVVSCAAPRPDGEVVVVWLRIAVRGHDNPVLDLGRRLAAALDRPLLVYHAVSERYPHASDRHHTFILQGARDLVAELDALDIASACHVERPGHRGAVLKQLGERAAVVVCDAMPLDPLRRWTESLAQHVPVVQVDASCLAPMHLLSEAPERAYAFRDASQPLRDPIGWPWPLETTRAARYDGPLPFEPVDLRRADLAFLVGSCAIDHSVPPVADSVGGSVAGYARWAAFRDGPLASYARTRNNAALPNGVSRMSAYLHYGHVSPFRLASEASQRGADKFLDEMLTWREMAWHVCWHRRDAASVERLPHWAQQTLADHQGDARERLPLETLEAARTGNPLWDAAQRSLLKHGELHNNVRMTWGKAVLQWSTGPRQTLARLYELNDRYALDGRDPASVGGIQWCLGGHDRPFLPPRMLYGTVRPRSLEQHTERLDLPAYEQHVDRAIGSPVRVLVVGAGIAGSSAAQVLARYGVDVRLVDKGRAVGGRMSARRSPTGPFAHGAQSFTARDPRFIQQVRRWEAAGVVHRFTGRLGRSMEQGVEADVPRSERWVGMPKMSQLPEFLAASVPLLAGVEVSGVRRDGECLVVESERGLVGVFDRVVMTAPAPQAEALLVEAAPSLAQRLGSVAYEPCWAAMVDAELDLPFDALRLERGPLRWIARQDTLPGGVGEQRWVLHADAKWSAEHLDAEPSWVAEKLGEALSEMVGHAVKRPVAHRWRYARVTRPLGEDVLEEHGVLVAGDACLGGRVEDAWLSGVAAAGRILRELTGAERGGLGKPGASVAPEQGPPALSFFAEA